MPEALDRLHTADLRILRVSSVYETEPVGFKEQRFFLNLVAEAETDLFPLLLLSRTQKVELLLGRKRSGPANGPRSIDIDILLYGRATVHSARLDIPHPRMHERRFVLEPLAEIAPEVRHPIFKRTVREMLQSLPHNVGQVKKLARC